MVQRLRAGRPFKVWECPSEVRGARIRTWARMEVVAEGGIWEVTERAVE